MLIKILAGVLAFVVGSFAGIQFLSFVFSFLRSLFDNNDVGTIVGLAGIVIFAAPTLAVVGFFTIAVVALAASFTDK